MEAAKMGHKEAIKLLVENGADPNTINSVCIFLVVIIMIILQC